MRTLAILSLSLGLGLAGCGDDGSGTDPLGNGSNGSNGANGSNGGNGSGEFDLAACRATCDKTLGECGGGLIPQSVIDDCRDSCDLLPQGGLSSECISAANAFYTCVAATSCEGIGTGSCQAEALSTDAACGT